MWQAQGDQSRGPQWTPRVRYHLVWVRPCKNKIQSWWQQSLGVLWTRLQQWGKRWVVVIGLSHGQSCRPWWDRDLDHVIKMKKIRPNLMTENQALMRIESEVVRIKINWPNRDGTQIYIVGPKIQDVVRTEWQSLRAKQQWYIMDDTEL